MPPRHTILVVDDEPDVVKSVQDLLRFDYRVLGTTRAEDGLRLMQENEVHLVMTDQRMPEMTGVEFLSRLRGDHPEAVRLIFTGYADIKAVIDAINQGNVYRYIAKPWDPDELLSILKQAAEHYDLLVERRRLLSELQVKNQALEQANSDLRQADALKSAFIQVASHELRTPVMILTGLSELAVNSPPMNGRSQDWMGRIHQAGLRLQRLVDEMIKLLMRGRFESELHRRSVDLTQLLNDAANDLRPFVERRNQTLNLELAAHLGHVHIEPDKIRDSIDHLLMNAVKFTPDGGTITLAARRRDDQTVEIRIQDTGCGIDAEALPRVFDPFFTGFNVARHSSGTFEHGRRGLGLGLSVVKLFVEMHGGSVAVASLPGQGAAFTITLPAG